MKAENKYFEALKEIHALDNINNLKSEVITIKHGIGKSILYYLKQLAIVKQTKRNTYVWIAGAPTMQMAADILKFIREYNLNGMRRRREERSKLIGELLFNEPKQGATYQNSATEITEITEDVKCYRAKNGAVVWMTDSDLKRLNFEKVVPKPTLTKEEIDVKVQEFIHELKTNFTIKE